MLQTEQQAKNLAYYLQRTYTYKLNIWAPIGQKLPSVDISDNRMGTFFTKFGEVNKVKALMRKAGIETGDMEVHITLNRKQFLEIPNILVCRDRKMLVVVEGR